MLCPVCVNEEATTHPTLGILPGANCKARRDNLKRPDHPVEFTSDEVRTGRKQYSKDIIQPYRGNEASREYIEAYPTKAEKMFTKKELARAKNVWID